MAVNELFDMDDFEFSVLGFNILKQDRHYVLHGGLQDIMYAARTGFRISMTLEQILLALAEKGRIFDARTDEGKDYFVVVTDAAAYLVLGDSLLYSKHSTVPMLKIEGIDSERDVLTLSQVTEENAARVAWDIYTIIKSYATEVQGLQDALLSDKKATLSTRL